MHDDTPAVADLARGLSADSPLPDDMDGLAGPGQQPHHVLGVGADPA